MANDIDDVSVATERGCHDPITVEGAIVDPKVLVVAFAVSRILDHSLN